MKSGNNTRAPQWVYIAIHVLYILPNPFVFKLGIGGSWQKRMQGISGTMPGFVIPIFLVWLPFAYQIEQWMHRKMKRFGVRYIGSGKTEWFFIIAIMFALPILAAFFFAFVSILVFAGVYAAGYEITPQIALKWLVENWKPFLAIVGALKIAVICSQIILKQR